LPASSSPDKFGKWFADETKEVLTTFDLNVEEGTIPSYLTGSLIRLGPSLMHTAKRNYTNVLDGFGRITKWTLDGKSQKIEYQSQLIKSNVYNNSAIVDDVVPHVVQQRTEPSFHVGIPDLKNMDNTDVNLFKFSGEEQFLVFTDYATSNVVEESSLRVISNIDNNDNDCDGDCKGGSFSGSHPGVVIDSNGKQTIINWIGTKGAYDFEIAIYTMDSSLRRKVIGSIKQNWMPFSIHSVAVADNYVALVLGAVTMDFVEVGVNFCLACSTNDHLHSKDTRVYIFKINADEDEAPLSKSTPPVTNFNIPAEKGFFAFHYVNAFVEQGLGTDGGDVLSLDTCAYDTVKPFLPGGDKALGDYEAFLTPSVRDTMAYNCDAIRRLEIDIKGQKLLSTFDFVLRDADGTQYRPELTSVNPTFWGRSDACFAYGVTYHVHGSSKYEDMGIFKANLCAAKRGEFTTVEIIHEKDVYLGEPIFVPNPNGTSEDDGSLLIIAFDANTDTTSLRIYDAQTLSLVTSVNAPLKTPFEFHGQWLSS
jgi:carotenoid cleavage dioxygenase-like enzyme